MEFESPSDTRENLEEEEYGDEKEKLLLRLTDCHVHPQDDQVPLVAILKHRKIQKRSQS